MSRRLVVERAGTATAMQLLIACTVPSRAHTTRWKAVAVGSAEQAFRSRKIVASRHSSATLGGNASAPSSARPVGSRTRRRRDVLRRQACFRPGLASITMEHGKRTSRSRNATICTMIHRERRVWECRNFAFDTTPVDTGSMTLSAPQMTARTDQRRQPFMPQSNTTRTFAPSPQLLHMTHDSGFSMLHASAASA